jgi:beta-galactosidase
MDFDYNWKFFRGDVVEAERESFNDAHWRTLDVPHDWSIEDLPNQKENEVVGPFSKESPGGSSTAHTIGGIGWYRKTFKLPEGSKNKIIKVHFDGVYMDSDVWINGRHLGNHPYGYTPFHYDLTPYLNEAGKENKLSVRVRNLGKNSRWYTGSGIYRHVWLTATDPIHVAPFGIFVTTPEVSNQSSTIKVETHITNESKKKSTITLNVKIADPNGKIIHENVSEQSEMAVGNNTLAQLVNIVSPRLWSPQAPNLYQAIAEITVNKKVVDRTSVAFGIRTLKFSASEGFLLNGEKLLIRGACLHHDNGALGAKAIDRAEERKVELMKANGFNAIRFSHNPPSQVLLDACDRLGVLVIDEAFDMWQLPKNPEDYHRFFNEWWQRDLQAMILRDRNHPSIILWSIGNEIKERADSSGLRITRQLADEANRLDASRPVIAAICKFWEQPGKTWDESAKAFSLLDVGGYNYEWRNYEPDHEKFPERIMLGTESIAMEAFQNWQQVEKHCYVIGDFVWTGMDYLGEAGIGHAVLDNEKESPVMEWPWFNGYCGDLDLCGFKKPQSHYRDVVWKRKNLSMAVHTPIPEGRKEKVSFWGWPNEVQSWTWPGHEGQPLEVSVYTSSPSVRIELNNKLIETKILPDSAKLRTKFNVPYSRGTLKAISMQEGKDIDSVTLETVGLPYALRLTVDRKKVKPSKNDLAYVSVELIDEHGNVIPNNDLPVKFIIEGEGSLAGVTNAHPSELKSFQQPICNTFRGRCLVILQPNGRKGSITLKAEAAGVQPAIVSVQCED